MLSKRGQRSGVQEFLVETKKGVVRFGKSYIVRPWHVYGINAMRGCTIGRTCAVDGTGKWQTSAFVPSLLCQFLRKRWSISSSRNLNLYWQPVARVLRGQQNYSDLRVVVRSVLIPICDVVRCLPIRYSGSYKTVCKPRKDPHKDFCEDPHKHLREDPLKHLREDPPKHPLCLHSTEYLHRWLQY